MSVPAGTAFLDAVAARWLERRDPLARGLILLPTRRAARFLAEAFLRVSGGTPMLLPRIAALGALDETPLALSGALDLPPAVGEMERLAALSRMVLGLPEAIGGARTADRAWMLARELASLMDEAERAERPLAEALRDAGGEEHAAHWQVTLRFLGIVTAEWPRWLEARGLMNPAARQVALLNAQVRSWEDAPPADPVWIAGATGAIAAVARLVRVVARLDQGLVVLPGLDTEADAQTWEALDEAHPQHALRGLLADIGAAREDALVLPGPRTAPPGRARLIEAALLPAGALRRWRMPCDVSLAGLSLLEAANEQEEAAAIAMVLRHALETPGTRAALVTPDRALAGRVSAELLRWSIVADDSAGEPLADTPPAMLLRLLAQAVAGQLAPVPLLALLKHPLAAGGLRPAAFRDGARALERACLRGPKPSPGLAPLREAVAGKGAEHDSYLGVIEAALAPVLRLFSADLVRPLGALAPPHSPQAALRALLEAAEALAATDEASGATRLWSGEEGEALAVLLAEALPALAHLPDQPPSALPGLLDAMLEGANVRSRRALRGRADPHEHPRVAIWGLLEARLQSAELIVLGGLVEGVWPPATDPGPWMSRQMRARAGLASPEDRIGQAAHDFAMAACAAPSVVLSCPRRRDGAPAVPARWLARLTAYLEGRGETLPRHPAAQWATLLDHPEDRPHPVRPPEPRPALGLRPRELSVTEIETWLADPYAIYARRILGLKPLDPLEQATDAADYGSLVHRGLHVFLTEHGVDWPADAPARLRAAMERVLAEARLRPALREWWRPRLRRIADWVAETERARRGEARLTALRTEIKGRWRLAEADFTLTGRADRIELREGGALSILDYKTGAPPSQKDVDAGRAPQLPLEAAMAASGAFGADVAGETAELVYWHLTGGYVPGEARRLFDGDAARIAAGVDTARRELRRLIAAFDDETRPYRSQPHGRAPRFAPYARLARVAEWDFSEPDEP